MIDTGPLRDVLAIGLGVATGALSGAFGIGGAVISTPGVRLLGASTFVAVGTTLPSILPGAVSGTIRYARDHLVEWRVVAAAAPAGVVGAVVGSLLSHVVPGEGHWLMVLTAVIVGLTAVRMARDPDEAASSGPTATHVEPGSLGKGGVEPDPPTGAGPPGDSQTTGVAEVDRSPERHSGGLVAALGAAAGLLSGLLGLGGGMVLIPAFSQVLRLPLKVTVATSLACVGILAVPSTITHAVLGDIDWRLAVCLAAGAVPGARLGASLSLRMSDRRLRLAVAGLLGVVSLVYGIGELAAALP